MSNHICERILLITEPEGPECLGGMFLRKFF